MGVDILRLQRGKKNKENDFKAEFLIRQDQLPCVITLELSGLR